MNNEEYIKFKNLSESEQKKAAENMTLEELRELGQLAVPDLKSFLEQAPSIVHKGHLYSFGESSTEVEYLGDVNPFPFKRVGANDE